MNFSNIFDIFDKNLCARKWATTEPSMDDGALKGIIRFFRAILWIALELIVPKFQGLPSLNRTEIKDFFWNSNNKNWVNIVDKIVRVAVCAIATYLAVQISPFFFILAAIAYINLFAQTDFNYYRISDTGKQTAFKKELEKVLKKEGLPDNLLEYNPATKKYEPTEDFKDFFELNIDYNKPENISNLILKQNITSQQILDVNPEAWQLVLQHLTYNEENCKHIIQQIINGIDKENDPELEDKLQEIANLAVYKNVEAAFYAILVEKNDQGEEANFIFLNEHKPNEEPAIESQSSRRSSISSSSRIDSYVSENASDQDQDEEKEDNIPINDEDTRKNLINAYQTEDANIRVTPHQASKTEKFIQATKKFIQAAIVMLLAPVALGIAVLLTPFALVAEGLKAIGRFLKAIIGKFLKATGRFLKDTGRFLIEAIGGFLKAIGGFLKEKIGNFLQSKIVNVYPAEQLYLAEQLNTKDPRYGYTVNENKIIVTFKNELDADFAQKELSKMAKLSQDQINSLESAIDANDEPEEEDSLEGVSFGDLEKIEEHMDMVRSSPDPNKQPEKSILKKDKGKQKKVRFQKAHFQNINPGESYYPKPDNPKEITPPKRSDPIIEEKFADRNANKSVDTIKRTDPFTIEITAVYGATALVTTTLNDLNKRYEFDKFDGTFEQLAQGSIRDDLANELPDLVNNSFAVISPNGFYRFKDYDEALAFKNSLGEPSFIQVQAGTGISDKGKNYAANEALAERLNENLNQLPSNNQGILQYPTTNKKIKIPAYFLSLLTSLVVFTLGIEALIAGPAAYTMLAPESFYAIIGVAFYFAILLGAVGLNGLLADKQQTNFDKIYISLKTPGFSVESHLHKFDQNQKQLLENKGIKTLRCPMAAMRFFFPIHQLAHDYELKKTLKALLKTAKFDDRDIYQLNLKKYQLNLKKRAEKLSKFSYFSPLKYPMGWLVKKTNLESCKESKNPVVFSILVLPLAAIYTIISKLLNLAMFPIIDIYNTFKYIKRFDFFSGNAFLSGNAFFSGNIQVLLKKMGRLVFASALVIASVAIGNPVFIAIAAIFFVLQIFKIGFYHERIENPAETAILINLINQKTNAACKTARDRTNAYNALVTWEMQKLQESANFDSSIREDDIPKAIPHAIAALSNTGQFGAFKQGGPWTQLNRKQRKKLWRVLLALGVITLVVGIVLGVTASPYAAAALLSLSLGFFGTFISVKESTSDEIDFLEEYLNANVNGSKPKINSKVSKVVLAIVASVASGAGLITSIALVLVFEVPTAATMFYVFLGLTIIFAVIPVFEAKIRKKAEQKLQPKYFGNSTIEIDPSTYTEFAAIATLKQFGLSKFEELKYLKQVPPALHKQWQANRGNGFSINENGKLCVEDLSNKDVEFSGKPFAADYWQANKKTKISIIKVIIATALIAGPITALALTAQPSVALLVAAPILIAIGTVLIAKLSNTYSQKRKIKKAYKDYQPIFSSGNFKRIKSDNFRQHLGEIKIMVEDAVFEKNYPKKIKEAITGINQIEDQETKNNVLKLLSDRITVRLRIDSKVSIKDIEDLENIISNIQLSDSFTRRRNSSVSSVSSVVSEDEHKHDDAEPLSENNEHEPIGVLLKNELTGILLEHKIRLLDKIIKKCKSQNITFGASLFVTFIGLAVSGTFAALKANPTDAADAAPKPTTEGTDKYLIATAITLLFLIILIKFLMSSNKTKQQEANLKQQEANVRRGLSIRSGNNYNGLGKEHLINNEGYKAIEDIDDLEEFINLAKAGKLIYPIQGNIKASEDDLNRLYEFDPNKNKLKPLEQLKETVSLESINYNQTTAHPALLSLTSYIITKLANGEGSYLKDRTQSLIYRDEENKYNSICISNIEGKLFIFVAKDIFEQDHNHLPILFFDKLDDTLKDHLKNDQVFEFLKQDITAIKNQYTTKQPRPLRPLPDPPPIPTEQQTFPPAGAFDPNSKKDLSEGFSPGQIKTINALCIQLIKSHNNENNVNVDNQQENSDISKSLSKLFSQEALNDDDIKIVSALEADTLAKLPLNSLLKLPDDVIEKLNREINALCIKLIESHKNPNNVNVNNQQENSDISNSLSKLFGKEALNDDDNKIVSALAADTLAKLPLDSLLKLPDNVIEKKLKGNDSILSKLTNYKLIADESKGRLQSAQTPPTTGDKAKLDENKVKIARIDKIIKMLTDPGKSLGP